MTDGRVALGHFQRVAVEIAGPVEPGPVGEIRHVDHERIAFPAADRMSHPCHVGIRVHFAQMDDALGGRELEHHHDFVRALENLKWIRHVHGAWHTRHKTLEFGITVQPVILVLLLSRRGPGLVRNVVALDDSDPWRNPAHRSEHQHRRCENRDVRRRSALCHHRAGHMGLKVPVRGIAGMPDSTEVGFARRTGEWRGGGLTCRSRPWCLSGRRLTSALGHGQRKKGHSGGRNNGNRQRSESVSHLLDLPVILHPNAGESYHCRRSPCGVVQSIFVGDFRW